MTIQYKKFIIFFPIPEMIDVKNKRGIEMRV